MKRFLPIALMTILVIGCSKDDTPLIVQENGTSAATSSYSGKGVRDYFGLLCKFKAAAI